MFAEQLLCALLGWIPCYLPPFNPHNSILMEVIVPELQMKKQILSKVNLQKAALLIGDKS